MAACCPFIPARMGTALTEPGESALPLCEWGCRAALHSLTWEWEQWESLCLVSASCRAWLKDGDRAGELDLDSTHPNWTSDWNNSSNASSSGTSSTNNCADFTCVWLTSSWGKRDRMRHPFVRPTQMGNPPLLTPAESSQHYQCHSPKKEHPKWRRLTWRIIPFIF